MNNEVELHTIYENYVGKRVYVMAIADNDSDCENLVVYHDFSEERLTYAKLIENFKSEFKKVDM